MNVGDVDYMHRGTVQIDPSYQMLFMNFTLTLQFANTTNSLSVKSRTGQLTGSEFFKITERLYYRCDFDRSRFGLVRKRSDFDSSGSVNHKRVYGSVCDQSEPSSSVQYDVCVYAKITKS